MTAAVRPAAVAPAAIAAGRAELATATPEPVVVVPGAEATAPVGPPLGPTPGLAGTVPFELAGGETAAVSEVSPERPPVAAVVVVVVVVVVAAVVDVAGAPMAGAVEPVMLSPAPPIPVAAAAAVVVAVVASASFLEQPVTRMSTAAVERASGFWRMPG